MVVSHHYEFGFLLQMWICFSSLVVWESVELKCDFFISGGSDGLFSEFFHQTGESIFCFSNFIDRLGETCLDSST